MKYKVEKHLGTLDVYERETQERKETQFECLAARIDRTRNKD